VHLNSIKANSDAGICFNKLKTTTGSNQHEMILWVLKHLSRNCK